MGWGVGGGWERCGGNRKRLSQFFAFFFFLFLSASVHGVTIKLGSQ